MIVKRLCSRQISHPLWRRDYAAASLYNIADSISHRPLCPNTPPMSMPFSSSAYWWMQHPPEMPSGTGGNTAHGTPPSKPPSISSQQQSHIPHRKIMTPVITTDTLAKPRSDSLDTTEEDLHEGTTAPVMVTYWYDEAPNIPTIRAAVDELLELLQQGKKVRVICKSTDINAEKQMRYFLHALLEENIDRLKIERHVDDVYEGGLDFVISPRKSFKKSFKKRPVVKQSTIEVGSEETFE